ncbi:type II toxin-antitoxin system VapC family toxin [Sphaerotilus sp.]|uniref:type II toxin-antitoxin system VapC family toxin n=1 Tax=Sphaerotilus sp. TaxID=2093942 RepID=UPI002ACDD2EF|nr:type II toxin-antitoxin system VapC family toxin [Sphaerotilus sp.]MDZ7856835.1 type II toxin-antitoxin system VapC family toxin [Sphaerotilus sp.]
MTRYLLDTNAVSAALRGAPGIDQRLLALDADDWCISAVTHSELRYGLALRPEALRLARMVEAFLQTATTAPWDAAAAEVHGRLRAALRQRGTPIGDFDEMIAAHALALGAVLVTDNVRHFEQVPGLVIENWQRA